MKRTFIFLPFMLCVLFSPAVLSAQDDRDSLQVIIETDDDNRYIGTIVYQDAEIIRLRTETLGEINIRKSTIRSSTPVKKSEIKDGRYWFENPYATTRYFIMPSGYGLPAGQGYYQNTWIFFNQVSVGLTDYFSVGLGTVPTFLFALGADDLNIPFWLTPKFSIPIRKDKFNVGIGGLYANILGSESDGGAGFIYGVTTFGSPKKNTTLGLGWGYSGDGFADAPTVSLSFISRGKPKWAFLTENYFISSASDALLILSGGARHMTKKLSIDFGGFAAIPLTESVDVVPILPWLSIVVPFGKKL